MVAGHRRNLSSIQEAKPSASEASERFRELDLRKLHRKPVSHRTVDSLDQLPAEWRTEGPHTEGPHTVAESVEPVAAAAAETAVADPVVVVATRLELGHQTDSRAVEIPEQCRPVVPWEVGSALVKELTELELTELAELEELEAAQSIVH